MDEISGAEPAQDAPNIYQSNAPGGGNLGLTVIGAALGAAVGAAIWAAVEYFFKVQVGYVAIAVGALAGWGAITLGRKKGPTVGVIAAVLGVGGIVAGSYGSYWLYLHGGRAKSEFREVVAKQAGRDTFTAEEETRLEAAFQEAAASISYVDYLTEDEKGMAFMALFGVLGLAYGFKVGRG